MQREVSSSRAPHWTVPERLTVAPASWLLHVFCVQVKVRQYAKAVLHRTYFCWHSIPSSAVDMLKSVVLASIVALSTVKVAQCSEEKPSDFSSPVRRRSWVRSFLSTIHRRSLPVLHEQALYMSDETAHLQPDIVRTVPSGSQAFSATGWQYVADCLTTLERNGVETVAEALCGNEVDMLMCLEGINEWIKHRRVFSDEFSMVRVGFTEENPVRAGRGPFILYAPLPTILARITRLSEVCVKLQDPQKETKLSVSTYVQACMALLFYHPSTCAAWCRYFGLSEDHKHRLYTRQSFPLWQHLAYTFYLLHKRPLSMESLSRLKTSQIRLLQPIPGGDPVSKMLAKDSMERYLRKVDSVLTIHGGPLGLTLEQAAERLTYWTVQAHIAPSEAM